MSLSAALLEDRGVVAVFGPDAGSFLQNLVTCDVLKLAPLNASLGALLSPQGKIFCDFLIARDDEDGFLVDITRALAGDLIQKLNLYRLRAKVEIVDVSDQLAVAALWGEDVVIGDGISYRDPRHPRLGQRAFLPRQDASTLLIAATATIVDADAYHAHRIALAIPEGGKDFTLGDTFPHEADLDRLGGVDFAKGCYVGQEVVSRMEHRTSVRKRVVPITFGPMRPMDGHDVTCGERVIGYVGSTANGRGLAMLRLDHVVEAQAKGETLMAGSIDIHPRNPDWADFQLAGGKA